MAVVTGDNVLLLIDPAGGGATVGIQCHTTSSLEITSEQVEVICKDGAGTRGIDSIGTFVRWSGSVEGYIDNDATLGYIQIMQAALDDTTVAVAMEITDPDGSTRTISGQAKISSVSLNGAARGEIATWSASFTGIGVPASA